MRLCARGLLSYIWLPLLLVCFLLPRQSSQLQKVDKLTSIISRIINTYNKARAEHEFLKAGGKVYIANIYGRIHSFDEISKELSLRMYLYRFWKDPTLPIFPRTAIPFNSTYLRIQSKFLWTPALSFEVNLKDITYHSMQQMRFDGWVSQLSRFLIAVPCSRVKGYRYPRDRYECTVKNRIWSTRHYQLTCGRFHDYSFWIRNTVYFNETNNCNDTSLARFAETYQRDWTLISFNGTSRNNELFIDAKIERRHPHFWATDILAGVAVGIVAVCQSLLPLTHGQRLMVGALGLLTAAEYIDIVSTIPVVREGYEMRLSSFSIALMALHAFSIVWSIITWNLSLMDGRPRAVLPSCFQTLVDRLLTLSCGQSNGEEGSGHESEVDGEAEWRSLILVLDRGVFVIVLLSFLIILVTCLPA